MKRIVLLGLFVAVLAAAGLWFGLPYYAEEQFRSTLDSYAAGRGDDRVGHEGARVDYWNDRAEIDRFTDRIDVSLGDGRSATLLVTLEGVSVEDYDLEALRLALAGEGSAERPLAERLSWQSVIVARAADGAAIVEGGPGAMERLTAARLSAPVLLGAADVGVRGVAQKDIRFALQGEGFEAAGQLDSFALSEASSSGVKALELGPARFELTASDPAWREPLRVEGTSGRLSVQDIVPGEPMTFARAEHAGFLSQYVLPLQTEGGQETSEEMQTVTGQAGYESYLAEGGRFDPQGLLLFPALAAAVPEDGEDVDMAAVSSLLEGVVVLMERAVELETGAERTRIGGLVVDVGDLQKQSIGSIEVTGVRGLRVERAVALDQVQTDQFGNRSVTARTELTDMDLSDLPAYLRRIFGKPVTAESLAAAGDYFRDAPLTEAIPAFDLGHWLVEDQLIEPVTGGRVTIDRYEQTATRSDGQGAFDLAFELSGLEFGLGQLDAGPPQAAQLAALLEAEGIERMRLDMAFDLGVGIGEGVIDIRELGLSAEKLGDAALALRLTGLDFEKLRAMPEEQRGAMMMQAGLAQAKVELTDEGLRRIAFRTFGAENDAMAEQVAEGLAMQAMQTAQAMGGPRLAAIGDTVAAFLRQGGTLSVHTAVSEAVPILQVMLLSQQQGPAAAAEALQLEASHSAPE